MYLCNTNLLLTERKGRPRELKRSARQNPKQEGTNQNARIYLKTTFPHY